MTPPAAAREVAAEHAVLLRQWAAVQVRVSRQSSEQLARVAALEAEVMRLRARWLVASTQLLWGLGWPALHAGTRHTAEPARSATEALCQAGCAGHAHPWRSGEGACQLTGSECTRVPAASAALRD